MSKNVIFGDSFCFKLDFRNLSIVPVKYEAGNCVPVRLPYNLSKREIFLLYCSVFKHNHNRMPYDSVLYHYSERELYRKNPNYWFIAELFFEILEHLDLASFFRKVDVIYIYTNTLNMATADDFKFCIEFL